MRRQIWIAAWIVALIGAGRELRAQSCCPPPPGGFLKRLAPAGGFCPYGGPILHWWPRCCFPCKAAPDDYCRKPLPRVCWPPYPPYYIWGPQQSCYPQCGCCCPANQTSSFSRRCVTGILKLHEHLNELMCDDGFLDRSGDKSGP